MSTQNIFDIAQTIRTQFIARKVSSKLLVSLYTTYHTVPDPKDFVEQARMLFPTLNCGIASLYLRSVLEQGKVVSGKYAGNSHTFLQLEDQTIVDITADQYGGPPVYIGKLQAPWALD